MEHSAVIKKRASDFLKMILHVKDIKIISAQEAGKTWEIKAEGYEEHSFIESYGLPIKVRNRNIYEIRMDDKLEIHSYEIIKAEYPLVE